VYEYGASIPIPSFEKKLKDKKVVEFFISNHFLSSQPGAVLIPARFPHLRNTQAQPPLLMNAFATA